LNALSQYNDWTYFPELQSPIVNPIIEFIQKKFETDIAPKISHPQYVIDFACFPQENHSNSSESSNSSSSNSSSSSNGSSSVVSSTTSSTGVMSSTDPYELIVIELNPFFQQTGSCLFYWRHDYKCFLDGPFQSRTVPVEYPLEERKGKSGSNVPTRDQLELYIPGPWMKVLREVRPYWKLEETESGGKKGKKGKGCLIS